jgi:hypothetical protein
METKDGIRIAEVYVPVRKCTDDNHEWLDLSCQHLMLEYAKVQADNLDKRLSAWAKANPVTRYALVKVTPIKYFMA